MKEDIKYMRLALKLARKGAGWVNPNPMVGAVIVRHGEIIGKGYHEFFGGPHAEVNAINSCKRSPRGATLYVTLEPCIHHGKTPPCADLIIQKRIKRVVIAMKDPNPAINGKGITYLKAHNIKVDVGVLEHEAEILNEVFVKFVTQHRPFCLFKGAMTLDGKIASATGESRWISGEPSRKLSHQLRHDFAAIMVGIGTILVDNPRLDARRNRKISKDPIKVIVDSMARISENAEVIRHNPQLVVMAVTQKADKNKIVALRRLGAQVVVCPEKNHQVDLEYLMLALGSMEIDGVLLEGGGTLAFSALKDRVIDKIMLFIAPKFLGGKKAPTIFEGEGFKRMSEATPVEHLEIRKYKEDFIAEGYLSCSQES